MELSVQKMLGGRLLVCGGYNCLFRTGFIADNLLHFGRMRRLRCGERSTALSGLLLHTYRTLLLSECSYGGVDMLAHRSSLGRMPWLMQKMHGIVGIRLFCDVRFMTKTGGPKLSVDMLIKSSCCVQGMRKMAVSRSAIGFCCTMPGRGS